MLTAALAGMGGGGTRDISCIAQIPYEFVLLKQTRSSWKWSGFFCHLTPPFPSLGLNSRV